jgi:hypothetical protein
MSIRLFASTIGAVILLIALVTLTVEFIPTFPAMLNIIVLVLAGMSYFSYTVSLMKRINNMVSFTLYLWVGTALAMGLFLKLSPPDIANIHVITIAVLSGMYGASLGASVGYLARMESLRKNDKSGDKS